jgi:hypothetical protein
MLQLTENYDTPRHTGRGGPTSQMQSQECQNYAVILSFDFVLGIIQHKL